MLSKTIGPQKLKISEIGLGCMGMSDFYGPADEKESISTIHKALDAGINWIDTGDFYGMGHNEMLIRKVAKERRDDMFIAVKFGPKRTPDGSFIGIDNSPSSVKNFLSYTLQRLGVDYIDLYQPARIDPEVPIAETVGAISEMIDEGYVNYLGLSEAGPDTIRKAHSEHPVSALQMEYSLMSRSIEKEILPTVRELDIGVCAYGVLSRGLLAGKWKKAEDFRNHLPRFSGENLKQNMKLVEQLEKIADDKNATSAQIAIAWVLAQGNDIVPLIGARTKNRLSESLGALSISLSEEDQKQIEEAVPAGNVAGNRYPTEQMKLLDSESET